ncbi:ATP-binding cassette domain-containing protein [Variovorax sp. S2]|uniref:ATP-binding cassette domain-containing protein n=1 Tax=Variovorax sp. S12S4 TaxID=3029170 RepID=UPI00215C3683|nr:ATP-binding cassette domain-containing protein [Variovorax sp. S12S4]
MDRDRQPAQARQKLPVRLSFLPCARQLPVRSLSGGERNRLLLARLFARPANVLVLDEPTNDLDIDTLELLEGLLQDYDGTVFLVSHDRTFLDNVVTSTIAFEGDGRWREYEGSVQDWLIQSKRAREIAEQRQAASPPPPAPAPAAAPASAEPATARSTAPRKKLSYKEQRELEALPAQIEALEAEQKRISEMLELDGGAIYATDASRAAELSQRHAQIDDELLAALERQEELSAGR